MFHLIRSPYANLLIREVHNKAQFLSVKIPSKIISVILYFTQRKNTELAKTTLYALHRHVSTFFITSVLKEG